MGSQLIRSRLYVEISIWNNQHDRYLITDLLGIEMGNGFDTTTNPNDVTTWSRISRKDGDDIQREFEYASQFTMLDKTYSLESWEEYMKLSVVE